MVTQASCRIAGEMNRSIMRGAVLKLNRRECIRGALACKRPHSPICEPSCGRAPGKLSRDARVNSISTAAFGFPGYNQYPRDGGSEVFVGLPPRCLSVAIDTRKSEQTEFSVISLGGSHAYDVCP